MNENNGGFMWIFGLIVLLALFNGGGFGFGGNQVQQRNALHELKRQDLLSCTR